MKQKHFNVLRNVKQISKDNERASCGVGFHTAINLEEIQDVCFKMNDLSIHIKACYTISGNITIEISEFLRMTLKAH